MFKNLIKRRLTITIVVTFLVVAVLFSFFIIGNKYQQQTPSPTISPTIPVPKTPLSPASKPFTVVRTTIPNREIGVYEGFTIEFSGVPSPGEFSYEISPKISVDLLLDKSTLYMSPSPSWMPSTTYLFTIKRDTKDIYGNFLEREVTIKFKTVPSRGL